MLFSIARHTAAKSGANGVHTKFLNADGVVGQQLSQLSKELAEEKVTRTCVCVCVYLYECVYGCIFIYMCVCMDVHVHADVDVGQQLSHWETRSWPEIRWHTRIPTFGVMNV
jgi:hypothetical protein